MSPPSVRLGPPPKPTAVTPSRVLLALAYLWLSLPFALFALGWLRWWLAVPLVGLLGWCLWLLWCHAPMLWVPPATTQAMAKLAAVVVLVVLWVFFSGIGRFSYQNEDHTVRNSIFNILVQQPWPVVDLNPPAEYFPAPVGLCYYIGFWLPPALVGKVLGMAAGQLAQLLWAVAGVLVFYWLVLAASVKRMVVWPLVVLVAFSGMDWIGASVMKGHLVNVLTATPHLDNWPDYFQYTSFTSQLYWVFNQALAGWVATALLMVQKNNRAMAFLVGVSLISATFPAMGMVPLAVCFALRNHRAAQPNGRFHPLAFAKGVLTPENLTGVAVALVSYLYLGSNNNGQVAWTLFHIAGEIWPLWLLFMACEVLPFYLLLYSRHKKEPVFWVMLGLQLLLPWLRLGPKADFQMRASIPILVVLLVWVVDALRDSFAQRRQPRQLALFCGLALVLVVGGATAQTEIVRSVVLTNRAWAGTGTPVAEVEWHPMEVSWRDNFYGPLRGNFFFERLMKPPR